MTGSIKGQIYAVFRQAKLLKFGTSRHTDKEEAKRSLQHKDSHNLNKDLGIYSYSTYKAYVKECIIFFEFAKQRFQLFDIEKINANIIEEFLLKSIADNISFASFKMRCSALVKLTTGLNIIRNTNKFDFYDVIQETKNIAKLALAELPTVRTYKDPQKLVDSLNEPYKTIAELQLKCGLRISEATKIEFSEIDERSNTLTVKRSKGGKVRAVNLSSNLTQKLLFYTKQSSDNSFQVKQSTYSKALRTVCKKLNVQYTGSHGLRWNYAQNRIYELVNNNVLYESALQQVSHELGHSRMDISKWYLQRS